MCQASLLQAFLQCLLLTLRKEHVSNLARTWGGAEDNLGSNSNLLRQKLQFSGPACKLSEKTFLHALILIFPELQMGFKNNSVCQWQSSLCHFSISLNVTSQERKKSFCRQEIYGQTSQVRCELDSMTHHPTHWMLSRNPPARDITYNTPHNCKYYCAHWSH